MVYRRDHLSRLDFEHNCLGDNEIEALLAEQVAAICHWKTFLTLEGNPGCRKFQRDSARVDGLEQARAERAVYGDATADGVVNERFEIAWQRTRYSEHTFLFFVFAS
jgi:hypothetical protein